MSREHLSEGGQFLIWFDEIKKYCQHKPQSVKICFRDSTKFQSLVRDISSLVIRIETSQANDSRKEILPVPDGFPREWEEYQKGWKREIENAYLEDMFSDIWEEFDKLNSKTNEQIERELFVEADYDHDDSFDPLSHNPAVLFYNALYKLENDLEGVSDMWEESLYNQVNMGMQGFRYVENTIGVDLKGIAERWRKTPNFQIPQSMAQAHSNVLYDRLYSAYKSYVFGLFDSTIIMCRAVCEEVLKVRFPAEKWADNTGKSKSLKKFVSDLDEAERNFELKKVYQALKRMIDTANLLIHASDRQAKQMSKEELEKKAAESLFAVKGLIEFAPRS